MRMNEPTTSKACDCSVNQRLNTDSMDVIKSLEITIQVLQEELAIIVGMAYTDPNNFLRFVKDKYKNPLN